jgi:UDP-2,3-diacylglucosamine hydrolase
MTDTSKAPPARSRPGTSVTAGPAVVVGDAHLGSATAADERAFHVFLDAVPSLARRLIIMGDLFDFWFEYRAVIPRRPFPTLARLAALVEHGVEVQFFGGNHDRWGGSFWDKDLGIPFHAEGADLDLAGRKAWVVHGDGLVETKLGGRLIHRITRHPLTVGTFRMLPPNLGFWLADRLSGGLAESNRSEEAIQGAALAQEAFALGVLDRRPELGLVVMAHTHRQRLVEHRPGRFYLNAGQWMIDRHYAVVSQTEIRLMRWEKGEK